MAGKSVTRCGSGDHLAATYRFAEATCRHCKKKGHLAPICYSAPGGQSRGGQQGGSQGQGSRAQRLAAVDASEAKEECPMFRLGSK